MACGIQDLKYSMALLASSADTPFSRAVFPFKLKTSGPIFGKDDRLYGDLNAVFIRSLKGRLRSSRSCWFFQSAPTTANEVSRKGSEVRVACTTCLDSWFSLWCSMNSVRFKFNSCRTAATLGGRSAG